jgi:hypothetical protein
MNIFQIIPINHLILYFKLSLILFPEASEHEVFQPIILSRILYFVNLSHFKQVHPCSSLPEMQKMMPILQNTMAQQFHQEQLS